MQGKPREDAAAAYDAQPTHISDLTPDPDNARLHNARNIGVIVDALNEVGAARSIVIDEHNVVLAGNGVLEGAAEAGIERVRVVEADGQEIIAVRRRGLTSDQKKRLALYDNRAGELSEWDTAKLAAALTNPAVGGEKLWTAEEAAAVIAAVRVSDQLPAEEERPTPIAVSTDIERGDAFQLGRHLVVCGDCLTDTPALTYGAVVTDPPDGINYNPDGGNGIAQRNTYRRVEGDDVPFDPSALFAVAPAPVYALWGANYFPASLPSRGRWLVWDKMRPENTSYSDCELAWVNDNESVAVKIRRLMWHGMIREGDDGARVHPTQKPVALMAWCIEETVADPNARILDPYAGSGSTLLACELLGRRCVAVEIDPAYVQTILDRWEERTGQKAAKLPAAAAGATAGTE